MAAASSRIWNTADLRLSRRARQLWWCTTRSSSPYQGAAVSVSVGAGPRSIEPDIRITAAQRADPDRDGAVLPPLV